MTVKDLSEEKCCGCAACMDKCPVRAISMHYDNNLNRVPIVDDDICISCGQCVKVCPGCNETSVRVGGKYTVYLATYKNGEIEKHSSSGGLFAALAQEILNQGGAVYGASMLYKDGRLQCQHIRIDNTRDLHLLQGSKYVQSRTDGIYKQIKEDLKEGKIVLFSGTSCQVASLKRFVGENENLYTIDLVCHGVPKDQLFKDYIDYCEKRYKCKIVDVSFRSKGIVWHKKEFKHVLTLSCNKGGTIKKKVLVVPKSSYYSLFMTRAGYRSSCYSCIYASTDKPADITLGDYTLTATESKNYHLPLNRTYSTIIVHNKLGQHLLESIKDNLIISEASSEEVIAKHGNLNHPSVMSSEGEKLYAAYLEGGYPRLQKLININIFKTNIIWILDTVSMSIKAILGNRK